MKKTAIKSWQNESYTTSLLVTQTPKEVFDAIINVRGWWTQSIAGITDKPGAEFLQYYRDVHITKLKIAEFIPGKKVVWLVTDSYFNFTRDESEWKGTKICFEILRKDNQTQLLFTHLGLVPEHECYDVCNNAWTNLIQLSLSNLITKGKGQPDKKENDFNPTNDRRWKLSGS